MKSIALLAVTTVILAGCSTTQQSPMPTAAATVDRAAQTPQRDSPPAPSPATAGQSPPSSKSDAIRLEAYEVRESAFSDFGMSLKTNFDVRWGGRIEWMVVSAVDPGSSASHTGLLAGDRIMAIDGRLVTAMDRDTMLALFFQRKKGDVSRLLVLSRKESLPRFLTLTARRPEAPSRSEGPSPKP